MSLTGEIKNLYIELGKDKKFSGIELVSGSQEGEYNVSNLQALLARDILGDFEGVPIIGITDSHYYTSDPICGKHYTIVISDDKEENNVLLYIIDVIIQFFKKLFKRKK